MRRRIPTDVMTTEAWNLWIAIEDEDHDSAKTFFANSNGATVASTITELLLSEDGPDTHRIAEFLAECYGM